jgi:hypothetical protein
VASYTTGCGSPGWSSTGVAGGDTVGREAEGTGVVETVR